MREHIIDNELLLSEWNWAKNSQCGFDPNTITLGSGKAVWWKCRYGHEWLAKPYNRINGNGCPYCSGRMPIRGYNDLATIAPELLSEWDFDKNAPDTPETVSAKSSRSFWWKCKCGHEWQANPCQRARGDGCPYCSGHRVWKGFNDLATVNPSLVAEWNYDKNGNLMPDQITASSNKKVWWKCEYGHEWQTSVAHRNLDGTGCPYCSGLYVVVGKTDLATVNPVLAKEWHPTKNKELTPQKVTASSEKRVWWLCPICNFEWMAKPALRNLQGTGCPMCKKRNRTSFPEQAIFYYVRRYFTDAINSYTELFDNGMELDVFIPSKSIGIEYDGYRHRWRSADTIKYRICQDNRIFLIRVSEVEREKINSLCDKFIISYYLRPNDGGLDYTLNELFSVLGIRDADHNTHRDRMKIYEQYLTRLKDNSLAEKYPSIASDWHPTKNGSLLPEMFSCGSGEKVWWKCNCGYEWQATITSRTSNGVGCPKCGRLKVKRGQIEAKIQGGKNSLFAVHPEFEANGIMRKTALLMLIW